MTREPNTGPRKWASTEETAEALPGVSQQTLANWRYEGRGPRYYKVGRKVIYDLNEVFEWVESNARTSTARAS